MMIVEDQERVVAHNLQYELANMVTNTQWSYAIFWTVSSTETRVLKWGEGYYNGDTRKMCKTLPKSYETDTNHMGFLLQRSVQLRELYESMLESKAHEVGSNKICVTLSKEDLSDLEWFYVLSMSFTFTFGQSLPGRVYATGQPIWLSKAQTADSNVFTRSLLAKSASVQTVICFPHMEGVIELGSTELISEDWELIWHIMKTSQEVTKPMCSQIIDGEESFILPTIRDEAESLNLEVDQNGDNIIGVEQQQRDENTESMNDYGWEAQPYHLHKQDHISPFYVSEEERELEQFMILRSLVPSATKTDGTTMHYEMDFDMDNEGLTPTNDLNDTIETDFLQLLGIEVSAVSDEVQVELSCPCREYLLLDIIKVLHNFNLDTHTVQSSTFGGALILSLKAKVVGAASASEPMIKQALTRIVNMG